MLTCRGGLCSAPRLCEQRQRQGDVSAEDRHVLQRRQRQVRRKDPCCPRAVPEKRQATAHVQADHSPGPQHLLFEPYQSQGQQGVLREGGKGKCQLQRHIQVRWRARDLSSMCGNACYSHNKPLGGFHLQHHRVHRTGYHR